MYNLKNNLYIAGSFNTGTDGEVDWKNECMGAGYKVGPKPPTLNPRYPSQEMSINLVLWSRLVIVS